MRLTQALVVIVLAFHYASCLNQPNRASNRVLADNSGAEEAYGQNAFGLQRRTNVVQQRAALPTKGTSKEHHASCPHGAMLYRDSITGLALQCSNAGNTTLCPPPFTCAVGNDSIGYCCIHESKNAKGCPPGQVAYVANNASEPQFCSIFNRTSCPETFYCQYSEQSSRFQCCRIDSGCPLDGAAEIDPTTGRTKTCSRRRFDCSEGSKCLYSEKMQQNICCKTPANKLAEVAGGVIDSKFEPREQPKVFAAQHADFGQAQPVCLDWLENCPQVAANGQCGGPGDINWVSCCQSCKASANGVMPPMCYDKISDCATYKATTEGFCTSPGWSFFCAANCYKTCFC